MIEKRLDPMTVRAVPFQEVTWHGRTGPAYSFRKEEPCNAFCSPPTHAFLLYLGEADNLVYVARVAGLVCARLRVKFERVERALEAKSEEDDPDSFCVTCLVKGCEHQKENKMPYLVYCRMS